MLPSFYYFFSVEYQIGSSQASARSLTEIKPPQTNKDDAYADFMKEMQTLL